MQDGSKTYTLKTGKEASERLDIQNKLLEANSYSHLRKAGLGKGKTVFDIGCGSGAMTLYFAKEVGESGHVYALDISESQIEYAKKKVSDAGCKNVTFICGDILEVDKLPKNLVDIVYSRLVLMHIQNHTQAIKNMKSLLKPDGVIAAQEFYGRKAAKTSTFHTINKYIETLAKLRKHNKLDYDVGNKLEELFKRAGFSNISATHIKETLHAKECKDIFIRRVIPPKLAVIRSRHY